MSSSRPSKHRLAPHTASTDEQRLRLVQSAYQLIVEKGMGGLHIREVASRIGLNHATLLYYFPTKEALIQAVVAYCTRQFQVKRDPQSSPPSQSSEHLRQHYLSHLTQQLHETPELFLVVDELQLYARRDPVTYHLFEEAVTNWQCSLESFIQGEIATGRFQKDLDVRSTALTVMAFCHGIGLLVHQKPEDIDGVLTQFARWLGTLSLQ